MAGEELDAVFATHLGMSADAVDCLKPALRDSPGSPTLVLTFSDALF